MLGAAPVAGRLFRSGEDAPGSAQAVVLSHGYWQRRFAGRADIIGQTVTIENVPHIVIGIVSPEFPLSGSLFAGAPIDMYLPLAIDGNDDIGGFMAVIGRLRPGVSADQAQAELGSRQAALSVGKWQWMTVLGQRVTALPLLVTREVRSPVLLLLAGVGCVLLMACVNLANLLLVRASGRRREMQVRAALGASIGRVLRSTHGRECRTGWNRQYGRSSRSPSGSQKSFGVRRRLHSRGSARCRSGGRRSHSPSLCAPLSRWSLAAWRCCTFGVETSWMDCGCTPGSRQIDAPCSYSGWRLPTQVAVVVVLTVAGGLLLRSLAALLDVDPGFNPRGAMAIRVDPAGRLQAPDRLPFFNQVIQSVEALPGVDSAALTIHVPMGDRPSMGWDAIPEGREHNPVTDNAAGRIVSPGYFRTIGYSDCRRT